MPGTGRVLIAELDSLAQAERFADAAHPGDAITELSGVLRLGVLVSSTVMVTDVMLFDGAYFVALGPDGVLAELGASRASFPLTITGTHESLAHALAAREAAGPAFSWSLPQIGDDAVIPDSVRRAWAPWLDLADRGLLRYERQTGGAPLRLGEPPRLTGIDADTIAETELDRTLGRSVAIDRIDALHLTESDRAALFAWWNDGYLRMIAENAGADWLSFSPAGAAGVSAAHGDVPLPLSAALSAWARDARPASVALAMDASRTQRRALRDKPTWPRMRDLAYAITAVSSAPSRRGVILGSLVRLALALCVVALAIPGLGIGSLDNPWTWLAFVGVIATTVPWDALVALLGLLRRDPRATLMLHRGTR